MSAIQLNRYVGPELSLTAAGLADGLDALVLSRALRQRLKATKKGGTGEGRVVFIARDEIRARNFADSCRFFAPDLPVMLLPAWDCLPFDRVSPSRNTAAERAAALYRLANSAPDQALIIVTTISAMMQRVPPRAVIKAAGFSARTGQTLERGVLEQYLSTNGYARATTVMEPGDFAIRGGIIDIFPPNFTHPIRFDFFGDELEGLRTFDVDSQRTKTTLSSVELAPVSEIFMGEDDISLFRRNYIMAFGGGISADPLYASVIDGIRPQGVEHFLPLFYEHTETVFDYIGGDSGGVGAIYAYDGLLSEARSEREDVIADFYDSRANYAQARDSGSGDPRKIAGVYRPLPPQKLYLIGDDWREVTTPLISRYHSPFIPPEAEDVIDFGAKPSRNFSPERKTVDTNVFAVLVDHIRAQASAGKRVLLACWTQGSAERMGSVLEDHGLVTELSLRGPDALAIPKGSVRRVLLPIEHGFVSDDLLVISEQDILGDRLVNRGKKRKAKNFIAEAAALRPGDLIIHIDHGLGRYIGLKTLTVTGAPHDCLELEYHGGSRLYLPVENIELLSRYGTASANPLLDKLGGVAWQSRKAKAKKRLRDMAGELIKIAAKRALRSAEPIDMPDGAYAEFCARFPYAETDDQLSAIEDVMTDLGSGRPMDRLICGDVGFGKTEVALRAAFGVALSGKQVAIVVPTTILSRQHFKTFEERFRGWPVNVRQLSRLVSAKDAKETKEQLATGRCEIVIGTHALLAKTIKFSDLGLLIVDEEQRFGVGHKESLKALRADVNVLTLTATPIPRTLQMALSGIRDLSLIATPPVDRLAVRTYVAPFDDISIRKAILRERYRGGQSFFVAPRIADLSRLEEFMQKHVPEVKYVIAHGQMAGSALEDIMTAFYDGQYDVLLSTSIIESGIDIARANTMIIYRADRFGLAQLYQMRGRVGRSRVRAYAYLTIPDGFVATDSAIERLKILQSLDSLGAGFTLASHDLDMRGGGNPLGEEQSGNVKEVGVELYQHMLEEAVAELRDDEVLLDRHWSPQVNVGVAVLIPEGYIKDLNLRLATYRRISDVSDDSESDALAAELIDRFGSLPSEVESLLKVMQIKRLCRTAHVEKIDAGPKGVVMSIRHQDVKDPSAILNAITQNGGWRLRPDQTIFVSGHFTKAKLRIKGVERALRALIAGNMPS